MRSAGSHRPSRSFSLRTLLLGVAVGVSGGLLALHWGPWVHQTTLGRIPEEVLQIAFSADGETLVTRTLRAVRVWSSLRGRLIREFGLHGAARGLCSADGVEIHRWGGDTATGVDLLSGRTLYTRSPLRIDALSHDRRLMASAEPGAIRILDTRTGRTQVNLVGTEGTSASFFEGIHFSPNGRQVLLASKHRTAIWSLEAGDRPLTLDEREGFVFSAAFSADGRRVVDVRDGGVRVWDAGSGRRLAFLEPPSWTQLARFCAGGRGLVLAGPEEAGLWSVASGTRIAALTPYDGAPNCAIIRPGTIAVSPDGAQIATAGADLCARIWDAETGTLLDRLDGSGRGICAIVFSPDGRRLATADRNQVVRVFLRTRPYGLAGITRLPAFWLTLFLVSSWLGSLFDDRRTLRAHPA